MYKMKKVLFGFICLLALSFTVSAQPGQGGNRQQRTPEESAKQYTETLKTQLNLTARQVAPVDSVNLVYAKAIAKLRENAGGGGGGDFSAMRESMQKLEDQRVTAFGKILTDEQVQAYKKYLADRPQRGQGQGQGQGGQRRNN